MATLKLIFLGRNNNNIDDDISAKQANMVGDISSEVIKFIGSFS
jgi:hypothetical protein